MHKSTNGIVHVQLCLMFEVGDMIRQTDQQIAARCLQQFDVLEGMAIFFCRLMLAAMVQQLNTRTIS